MIIIAIGASLIYMYMAYHTPVFTCQQGGLTVDTGSFRVPMATRFHN
jgi:hypothetical protein